MRNRIDVQLTPEQQLSALTAVDGLRQSLGFLIDLTSAERKGLPKFGDRSVAFIQKCLEVAKQDSGFLPRNFDVGTFENDVNLMNFLIALNLRMSHTTELLADTLALTGAEAYSAALEVYRQAKGAPGLEEAADELAQRFAQKSRLKPEEEKEEKDQ